MQRIALITGIGGQDGSYLAELLIQQGYAVHGIDTCPLQSLPLLKHLQADIVHHELDLRDQAALDEIIGNIRPHEIYNLAACSFVPVSWEQPVATSDVNALGVTRLLHSIRCHSPTTRFFQAGSSEMFGDAQSAPQDEETPLRPQTPYGAGKTYAHWLTRSFREKYGLFACSGILFNHESPRRPERFVSRKITSAAAAIKLGLADELQLGDLRSRRDWGFAGDYVRAMWLALQADRPNDYVIGTGQSHSLRDFVDLAFQSVGLDWQQHCVSDPSLHRTFDSRQLRANPARARRLLGWEPDVSFEQLIQMMVQADLKRLREPKHVERAA
jgi:GDPmannose 4,6-dehydratase